MSAATSALIGAFGGALIGLAGAWLLDVLQNRRAERKERRRAFAAFLGALYPAIGEFREMPPNREGGLYEKLSSVLQTDQAAWVQARRGIAQSFPDLFGRIDRLLASLAVLQVLDLSPAARTAIDEATDYAERLAKERSPKVRAEWPEIHDTLMAISKSL